MTDISVMSEWQVAGVGGTRPLENVLGEALKDDLRSKLEIISFLSRVMSVSKSFFLFPALLKDLAPNFQALGLLFRPCLGGLFENSALSTAFFCELRLHGLRPQVFFLKISFLFSKTEPMLLAWPLVRSPSWAKHFVRGTSKTRMKTWLPCVGETERRRTMVRSRDWYESCAAIHGPKRKKTRKSACDCAKAHPSSSTNQRVLRSLFPEIRCRYRFAFRCFRGRECTAAGRWGCSARKAKKSSHPWHFRYWSLRRNELECTNLIRWTGGIAPVFRHVMQLSLLVLCWKSTLAVILRDTKKKRSLSNVATGVPKLKTCLGTHGLKSSVL